MVGSAAFGGILAKLQLFRKLWSRAQLVSFSDRRFASSGHQAFSVLPLPSDRSGQVLQLKIRKLKLGREDLQW